MGPRSLRNRLALLFAVGAGAVLVAAAVVVYVSLGRQLDGAIDDGVRARADDLAGFARRTDGQLPDEDTFSVLLTPDGTIVDTSAAASTAGAVVGADDLVGLPAGGRWIDTEVRALRGPARVLVRPVDVGDRRLVLVVAAPTTAAVRAQERVALVLLIMGPFVAGALALAGWLLAGAALRPVGAMAAEADTISSLDELDRRLPQPAGDDEIARLGRTLNAMLDRIEAAVERQRGFLDDASHELRTPITILRGELELALGCTDDPAETEQALRSAIDEADRLSRLADDLLTLARSDASQLELRIGEVDLRELADRLVRALPADAPAVTVTGDDRVVVEGDADRLAQVLTNLLTNARHFARSTVSVAVVMTHDGAEVVVADDGPGFADALLPVAFERFRRADRARSRDAGGTGLGLAIAASLVAAHGGSIRATNGPPLGGAVVVVDLPSRTGPGTAPPPASDPVEVADGTTAGRRGRGGPEGASTMSDAVGGGGRESNPPDGDRPSHPL